MEIFAYTLGSLCVLFTLLPLIHTKAGWVRVLDFPRLQIAVGCLIAAFLLIQFRDQWAAANIVLTILLACAFVYQSVLIIKFTPFFPIEAPASSEKESSNSFSILHSNIRLKNRDTKRLRKMIEEIKPDIVSINEPDQWWEEELRDLCYAYPHIIKKPLPNTYGMMLYSKLPLKNIEINFLVADDVPSFFAQVELPSGKSFDLYCVHPEPPQPGSPTYERDTELLIIGKQIKKAARPAIVVGDLNDVAWSYTSKRFREFSGTVDPRRGRGLFNTYNAFIPLFRYPLDHFFYTKHFGLNQLKKMHAIGSDHFPMLIGLQLAD